MPERSSVSEEQSQTAVALFETDWGQRSVNGAWNDLPRIWSTPPVDSHADDSAFGYWFIADELPKKGHYGSREQDAAPMNGARHVLVVLQEAGPEPEIRTTGRRPPGGAGFHCSGTERSLDRRQHRAPTPDPQRAHRV